MIGASQTSSSAAQVQVMLPKRMHALATEGYRRYFEGKRGFAADDLSALREGLEGLAEDPHAVWAAVSSLGLLAVLVEKEGDVESGQHLRGLIATGGLHLAPIAGAISKALGLAAVPSLDDPARRAAETLSGRGTHRAAFHDAPAPRRSLPLYAVDYAMVSARFREVRLVQGPSWRASFPGR
ncbi:MAG: hypothetical protein AAFZ18_03120 [Myxococcota bacterium]